MESVLKEYAKIDILKAVNIGKEKDVNEENSVLFFTLRWKRLILRIVTDA